MDLYEAEPSDANGRAVIVVQEAFGVNGHIEDVTRRFAGHGYHAVAPHLFHRTGGGTIPYDALATVGPMMEALDDAKLLDDIDATVAHLRAEGFDDQAIGIVGFCMGGRVSFLVAGNRRLGAAVGFYGAGVVTQKRPQFPAIVDLADDMKTPFLGLFGDADPHIPVDEVETLRSRLAAAGADAEIVRYPDADHGFHCDDRPVYHQEASRDAWSRTIAWFGHRLTPAPR